MVNACTARAAARAPRTPMLRSALNANTAPTEKPVTDSRKTPSGRLTANIRAGLIGRASAGPGAETAA